MVCHKCINTRSYERSKITDLFKGQQLEEMKSWLDNESPYYEMTNGRKAGWFTHG